MTDPRRQRFAPYIRRLADLMRLKDWDLAVSDENAGADNEADISTIFGQKRARIRLSDEFLDKEPARQRETLVHELVHCHIDFTYQSAVDHIPESSKRMWQREAEMSVDTLALVIAPFMPLPDEEAPK